MNRALKNVTAFVIGFAMLIASALCDAAIWVEVPTTIKNAVWAKVLVEEGPFASICLASIQKYERWVNSSKKMVFYEWRVYKATDGMMRFGDSLNGVTLTEKRALEKIWFQLAGNRFI